MRMLEDYCSRYLSINQLVAIVAIDNEKSQKLFSALDYREVGLMKWWLKRGSEYVDAIMLQKKL